MQKISGKADVLLWLKECHLDSAGSCSRILKRFPLGLFLGFLSLGSSHQGWYSFKRLPVVLYGPWFLCQWRIWSKRFWNLSSANPSSSSSSLTFTSWKHPGGLSQSSQGSWKLNYTALGENTENIKTLQSLGVKWQEAVFENESFQLIFFPEPFSQRF